MVVWCKSGGLEPGKPGFVSWFCHQPTEGTQIHSSASLSLFSHSQIGEHSLCSCWGGLNRILHAKPLACRLPPSQLSLNASCCHCNHVISWKYQEEEVGSSQAHPCGADHPEGTTVTTSLLPKDPLPAGWRGIRG